MDYRDDDRPSMLRDLADWRVWLAALPFLIAYLVICWATHP